MLQHNLFQQSCCMETASVEAIIHGAPKKYPLNEISKLLFFQKLPIDLRTFLHTKYSIVYINGIYNPQY